MRTRTTPAFGTEPTRLHTGRILLVAGLIFLAAVVGWRWLFHRPGGGNQAAVESSTAAGWTAAQQHYDKPEVKIEAPAPKPIDMTAAELARISLLPISLRDI
jgi:hypothetical protein